MVFHDRLAELAWLEEAWQSGRAEFRILYGRRRTGKSALLDRVALGKRHILFQAAEGSTADHLRDLTTAVLACQEDPVLRAAPFANWEAALAYLNQMAGNGRLLVVIDEYQFVAEADPTLASRLQRWWSRQAVRLPIVLILCGSYIRFFVENVLTGPMYGRNTGSLQLHPLGYREAGKFFPRWSAEDRIRGYAVAGGIPYYLEQFDPDRGLAWNVAHHILRRGSLLYREAELLMREELREPRLYFSIVRAISDGCNRVNDIATRVLDPSSRSDLTPYLRNLAELGLVEYREPAVGTSSRRGIWRVVDPYLRFWFRFVIANKSGLEHGADPQRVFRDSIAPRFDEFVSRQAFEEICCAWVFHERDAGGLDGPIQRVGPWWGPVPDPSPDNPRRQTEGEVDVVAADGAIVRYIGEAKWSSAPIGLDVLNHLRATVRHVPGGGDSTRLILFGRRFHPRVETLAAAEGIRLVRPDDLYA